MADRPILFSAPMIRAILDGRKTQTRRILKPLNSREDEAYVMWPVFSADRDRPGRWHSPDRAAPFFPGDRLWVRESCRGEELTGGRDGVRFRADDTFQPIADTRNAAINWLELHTYQQHANGLVGRWVPSIHMPRWASRITLRVTDVAVERLQEISKQDAVSEGIEANPEFPGAAWRCYLPEPKDQDWWNDPRESFRTLWESINGPGSWKANPWVAVIAFQPVFKNIDEVKA